MTQIYQTAIIGGGFSGLIAACALGEVFGEDVALIERLDRVGKKILATGNGRCNITNSLSSSVERYHSVNDGDVIGVINRYPYSALCDRFYALGVPVVFEGNKGFPASKQASSVVDSLRFFAADCGVNVFCGDKVDKIVKGQDGIFTVGFGERTVKAKSVVLACGGKSSPQYGTDGDGYRLAKSFGHTVTKLYPSLVQLKTQTDKIRGLKGIKTEVEASAIVDGKVVKSTVGDVLFTDYGVSGNAVFSLSSTFAGCDGGRIVLSFVPELDEKTIANLIREKSVNLPYLSCEDVLSGIVNKQLAKAIIRNLDVAPSVKTAYEFAHEIKNFGLDVTGTLGFDGAQVTRGGVSLDEVDLTTMQSKKVDGLYLVGEILDVDGDCGGFNLQWAFSSASSAAEAITKR